MSNRELKEGDVVYLKSNEWHPKMVIARIELANHHNIDHDMCVCRWFDKSNELQSIRVEMNTLKLAHAED